MLNDSNAWQLTIDLTPFRFSPIGVTWTNSRAVYVVADTQTVGSSVWTSRSTLIFSYRSAVCCSRDLLCFSLIDRGLVGLGIGWDGRVGVIFSKGTRQS